MTQHTTRRRECTEVLPFLQKPSAELQPKGISYTVTEPKASALLICAGPSECNRHNQPEASGLTKGIRRQCVFLTRLFILDIEILTN